MTNFPFSQKTKYSHYYGFTTRDANPVFLKHVIDSLKNEGRAGVVVPDGLLFDVNSEYIKLRQILLEKCNLMAVIQLDPFVFKPYTGQPTNILIFEKGKPTKNVWFFNVINDGYKKTGSIKGRPSIDENDLPLLRDSWIEKRKTVNSFSVDIETIKNNNYKLTLNSYKDRKKRTVDIKTLRELCEPPIIGGTPPRDNMSYWHGDNLWVKISDMADKEKIDDTEEKISDEGIHNSSAKKIASGTLLFSFKLTVGKTAIAGKDLFTNEAIAALIPKDKTDPNLSRYLYYILPTLDYSPYAQRATKGFTLNSETILDIEIPYPDPEIRKKIVMDGDKKELERLALIKKISDLIAERNEFIKINTS
jgi:hypothetical protein